MAFYRQQLLGGLIFLCLLKLISADGHVNIQLEVLQYDNPKGTSFQGTDYTSQRKCCDSGRNASACSTTDTCDTYFVICIGGVGQEGHCSGQSFRTETLRNSNSFTASSDNNLMKLFQWEHWHSGDIEYVVNVIDDDRNKDELIENFKSSKAPVVGTRYKNSALQVLSFSNFVSVDLGIRIWCQDSYGGPDCSNKCTNNTYSVCTHTGGSVPLPSCLDADVSRLEIKGFLTVKAKYIQLLLIKFILQNICPEAHSVNVDVVHFRLTGSVEFKAKCNNTAVSSLVFTTHMFVLSLTNKAALATYFPYIPLQTPSVIRKPGTGAHQYMILGILSYKDLSSSCHHQDCNIQISICVQGHQNSCLNVSSKLAATEMRICNGDIVDRLSTHQERSTTTLVPLTSWPILSVNVKYNNVLKWKRSNNVLHSYIAGALYSESKSHRMTIESFDRKQTLVIEMLIWCAQGWAGDHCQHECRSTTNTICNKNGQLVCRKGYHGSSCTDKNECSNKNPCKNGGTCHNTVGSFTCQCSTGWTGRTCEVDIDECELDYCLNATSCTNSPGSYHCRCARGFRGVNCTDNDECKIPVEICNHGGTCLNQYGSYMCRCAKGFMGHRCEQDIDECSQAVCQLNHTTCHNTIGSYNCFCRSGWTGINCNVDIDECKNTPCLHGSCSNTPGNYTCNCLAGYAGRHCENDFDECSVVKCANNGTCINMLYPERYRCDCLPGWDPKSRCHHRIDECKMFHPCVHGSCAIKYGQYLCTCDSGWTGKNCSVTNYCENITCKNNATCINRDSGFSCTCSPGWNGTYCSVDINECTEYQPCLNTGNCENTAGGYICNCPHEWSGKNCSVDVNECNKHNPCLNNATCQNTQGGYTCHCPQGWTGPNCSVDINECNEYSPCLNNATCRNTKGGYTCHCLQEWTGPNCSVDINECHDNNECKNNDTCTNTTGGYICHCEPGWSGENCSVDIDECEKYHPCKHKGICTNIRGGYKCNCAQGWTGRNCSDDIDECDSFHPCRNKAKCTNTHGGYTCNCAEGWREQNCSVDINECAEYSPCLHGTCNYINGSYICSCQNGWNGNNCSDDINECRNNSICLHGGQCKNQPGSYSCKCPGNWNGIHCEHDIDECSTLPCKYNGTCHNTRGSYNCTCPNTWTGQNCEIDVNECLSSPCKHNGTCTNAQGSYSCTCPGGWIGRNCESDVDECKTSACENGGTCINNDGSYACTCPINWTGNRCETDVNECNFLPCKHDGTCRNTKGSFACLCPHNWTGSECEVDVDECLLSPCEHNEICYNMLGSYTCTCPIGWSGNRCESDINECDTSPCLQNGTCSNTDGSYICSCPENWTGNDCETDVNECEAERCNNKGFCENYSGSFRCVCTKGWEGPNCGTDINECKSNVHECNADSMCRNTNGSYVCIQVQDSTAVAHVTPNLFQTESNSTSFVDSTSVILDETQARDVTTHQTRDNITNMTTIDLRYTSDPKQKSFGSSNAPKKSSVHPVRETFSSETMSHLETRSASTRMTAFTSKITKNALMSSVNLSSTTGVFITTTQSKMTSKKPSNSGHDGKTDVYSDTKSSAKPFTATSVATTSAKPSSFQTVGIDDAIFPSCTSSGWNVTVNMTVLQQLYPGITSSHIYFGDNSCRGRVVGNLLVFQQGFRNCLTSERISGDTLLYENDLYYAIYDPINPFIIRQHKWTYTVECDVSRNEATSSHIHHDIDAHHAAVSGHYNISIAFFKDSGYRQQISGNPLHANVGDNVYVKVFTSASDWSIKMRLHTCYTKPTEDADNMIFFIIKDGCEVDSNTHIISQSTHETRFVFQDFEYSTNREGLNIYCNATFCESQDYSPGCAQSCLTHGTHDLVGK